jgi:hypothetical protein
MTDMKRLLVLFPVLLLGGCEGEGTVEWSTTPLCGHGIEGVREPWRARMQRSVRGTQITGWECRLSDAPEHIRIVASP